MIDLQFIQQFMYQNFEQAKATNGGTHFLARCFLCGDSKKNPFKKRFNLNWNNGNPGWHCWNCGRHGNFIEIYAIVKGLSYEDAKKDLFKWRSKEETKEQFSRKKNTKYHPADIVKKKKEVSDDNFNFMFEKFFGVPWAEDRELGLLESKYVKHLIKFYEDRKISHEYKLYICHTGKYKGRIIIPIFDDNKNMIYFQARRIPKTNIEPKYDNPVAPKELCILNRDRFDPEKYIIICEGLIDAFMIGDQGTSCLGKEISEELIIELLKLTNKGIIIALDNDSEAYKSLTKFMQKNKYARKVKYFLYPKEFEGHSDINSYVTKSDIEIDMYELITQNSLSYSSAYTKLSILKLLEGKKRK